MALSEKEIEQRRQAGRASSVKRMATLGSPEAVRSHFQAMSRLGSHKAGRPTWQQVVEREAEKERMKRLRPRLRKAASRAGEGQRERTEGRNPFARAGADTHRRAASLGE